MGANSSGAMNPFLNIEPGSIEPIIADGKLDIGHLFNPPVYTSEAEKQLTYLENYLSTGNFQNHPLFTEYPSMLNGPAHAHLSILSRILSEPESTEIQAKAIDAVVKFLGEYYSKNKISGPIDVFAQADFVPPRTRKAVLKKLLRKNGSLDGLKTCVESNLKNINLELISYDKRLDVKWLGDCLKVQRQANSDIMKDKKIIGI